MTQPTSPTASAVYTSGTFAALRSPNFRLYFAGQLISSTGAWMQIMAQGFLVFQLTGNPLWVGAVACAGGAPMLLMAPITGVIVDRFPRRTLMIITAVVDMLLAFILAALVALSIVQIWHIVVLAFLLGITAAVDMPSRQAFVLEMVGRPDMQSGIQLNSLLNAGTRLLGPGLGGAALIAWGAVWCFFINGLSFVAVIVSLVLMKVPYAIHGQRGAAPLTQIREGLAYARTHALIAPLLLMVACMGLFTLPIHQLYAAFAAQALGSPDVGLSAIASGNGLGAVLAGVVVGWLVRRFGYGRVLVATLLANTTMGILFSLQTAIIPAAILAALAGLATVCHVVSLNTMIQNIVPDSFRGRVLSLYSLAFFGLVPYGSLALGALGERIGTAGAMLVSAALGGSLAAAILLRWPAITRQRLP
jgi:MFS family permease